MNKKQVKKAIKKIQNYDIKPNLVLLPNKKIYLRIKKDFVNYEK
ncbi:MAG: hypothetical protein PHP92_03455 [Candidatus Nanoarchaeia archaeon]|nr:hypothetical protein [Candidatus Nanoarchaeia archaeon]